MRFISVVTLSAALLLSSNAMAKEKLAANEVSSTAGTSQVTSNEPNASQAPVEKKICKRLVTSGTRMFKTACLTKDQWQKVEEEAK